MTISSTRTPQRSAAIRRWALLALALSTTACSSPTYVLEQSWGQLQLLQGRQRISEVLRRPALPAAQREQLELVLLARRYAIETIGLKETLAYTRYYDTGGKPLAYNLSGCAKDKLQPEIWRFPIVGAVPYLGFFELDEAKTARQRLIKRDLDTVLRPVSAYSSLGWFADPITDLMLEQDPEDLIELVIHEMTHTTLFVPGEVAFNESLAMFVGQQGTLNLLGRLHGPLSPQVQNYQRSLTRGAKFDALIVELYGRLGRLYSSDLPRSAKLAQREQHFRWAQQRYKQIFPDPARWGRFAREPLNNAVVLGYGRYHQGITFHRQAYRALGRDLGRLVDLYRFAARATDDPARYIAQVCDLRPFTLQRN